MPTDIDSKYAPRLLVTHLLLALITLSALIVTSPSQAQTKKPEAQQKQREKRDPVAAGARDQGRLPEPPVRPAGRYGLSRRRRQPALRGRAAHRHDLVVPQPARRPVTRNCSSSSPTRSTVATRRGCWAWRSTPSTRRTSNSSSTIRPMISGQRRSVVSRFRASSDNPRESRSRERGADLGFGGRPVREPQRRHDRLRAGRLPLHHLGRQRGRR